MVDSIDEGIIWSGSDLPYACLIDSARTETFKRAIRETVRVGDIVVDVGSGTGILSFFAASAGAKKVYAVEIDVLLAKCLKKSIQANGLSDVIEVISGDALEASLPQNVDVVIAELIETGLLEEMQVKVMNDLRQKGIVGPKTKVMPQKYETFVGLAQLDNEFYGYKITSPIHNWPNYSAKGENWAPLKIQHSTESLSIGRFDFQQGFVEPKIERELRFHDIKGPLNALKLTGMAHLTETVSLGATNTINGDKYLIIDSIDVSGPLDVVVSYTMGSGLSDISLRQTNPL